MSPSWPETACSQKQWDFNGSETVMASVMEAGTGQQAPNVPERTSRQAAQEH